MATQVAETKSGFCFFFCGGDPNVSSQINTKSIERTIFVRQIGRTIEYKVHQRCVGLRNIITHVPQHRISQEL